MRPSRANKVRDCLQCGDSFRVFPSTSRRRYCSIKCRGLHLYSLREKCPYCNERPIPAKQMVTCGEHECYKKHQDSKLRTVESRCPQCSVLFVSALSAKRIYCSYQCHLDSGGARRSGDAAARARMKYGVKKDANHKEMVAAMKKMGISVLDTSHIGCGFPDLIVGIKNTILLVDIKNPKTAYGRRGLNKRQREFAETWTGSPIYLVKTVEDVQLLAEGKWDELEHYGGPEGKVA